MIPVLDTRYIQTQLQICILISIFTFYILLSDEHPAKILIIYTKHATMKINEKFLSSTQARERQE